MNPTNKLRYVAYVRKSSEEEERQSLSIPAQKRRIKDQFPKLKIVKWLEESKSAFTPGREQFGEMMRILQENEADGIVGWHPDRLSRNEIDAAAITYGLRTGLIKDLKFGSYFFDNSPEGIMMLQNVMSHSQYFSSKLSKDIRRGNDEQRKRGWLTGNSIEGYLNARADNGMDYGVIVKDEVRFPLRRKMWDLMLTGRYSVPQILDMVNNEWGYMTRGNKRYPSGPMSRTALYNMFNNPRYAGKIPVPREVDIYEKAEYPAMVSVEEFDRVQDLLGSKGTRKLAARREFTYRGILACGECGCLITAEFKTRYFKNGNSRDYTYYHCTHKRPCSQRKNKPEAALQEDFANLLGQYTIIPQFKEWALAVLDKQNDVETDDINVILESQNRAIESAHKEMKGLIKMAAKEMISDTEFLTEKKELENRIEKLEEELEDTKKRADTWYGTFVRTWELAVRGREKFIKGDVETKRAILSDLGQNPVLLDNELQINTFPWLEIIKNEYPSLKSEYDKVRTLPEQIREPALEAVRSSWCRV